MRLALLLLTLFGFACVHAIHAQGAPQPQLLECGMHGGFEILCGTRSPEDLEPTPDGKSLIVSQFVNAARGAEALQMGNAIYVGSFQGERLLKFAWKE